MPEAQHMTDATLTPKQRCILAARRFISTLGLPVSYREDEFSYLKGRTDWSRLPSERINLLSRLFCRDADEISAYVDEAETISCENLLSGGKPGNDSQIGNPMGKTDRITRYVLIRLCKPRVAVETGSAAGASATYILAAMEENGRGSLYSIDAARDRAHLGCLIPAGLRDRLMLRYGNSLVLIPEIAAEAGAIDFFMHDSLHTYAHMTAEYELFYRHIGSAGGVICSHDILMSNAWGHFLKRHRLKNGGIVKNIGIAVIEP